MQIDCKLTGALSAQNIRVDVPTTITVAISTDPEVMQNAAERMLGLTMDDKQNLITDVVYGQMRLVIADMTIEELNSDRDKFLSKVKDNIDTELRKFGLYLMNINISDIRDAANYIVNLGKEAESKAQNEDITHGLSQILPSVCCYSNQSAAFCPFCFRMIKITSHRIVQSINSCISCDKDPLWIFLGQMWKQEKQLNISLCKI